MSINPKSLKPKHPQSIEEACKWFEGLCASESRLARRVNKLPAGEAREKAINAMGTVRLQRVHLEQYLGLPPRAQEEAQQERLRKIMQFAESVKTTSSEITEAMSGANDIASLRVLLQRCQEVSGRVKGHFLSWGTSKEGSRKFRKPLKALAGQIQLEIHRLRELAKQ